MMQNGFMAGLAALALTGCVSINDYSDGAPAAAPVQNRSLQSVSADGSVPTDVRRTTIIVRDMERSLAFWRDVLGLRVNYDTGVELSGVNLPVGEPGTQARLVLLNANDDFIGWIGLMELVDPPLDEPPYPRRLGVGSAVIVVNTDDVDARCAAAAMAPGVTVTAQPNMQTYPSRDGGEPIRVKGCNILDPDGIAVEINQLLN